MKKELIAATIALGVLSGAGQAATVLPDGSLDGLINLTRIDTGSTTLEFLNLSATNNMSIADAENAFSASGFFAASIIQASELFDAFGFSGVTLPNIGGTSLFSGGDAAALASQVGFTIPGFASVSIARFDNGEGGAASFCASATGFVCGFDLGIDNAGSVTDADSSTGVLLVRSESVAPVPLPASAPLLLLGLGALRVTRRRFNSNN